MLEAEKRQLMKDLKLYIRRELFEDDITMEDFKRYIEITKDIQVCSLFNSVMYYYSDHKIALRKILRNEEAHKATKKVVNFAGEIDEFSGEDILEQLANDDFIKFINLLETRVLSSKEDIYKLIKKFKKVVKIENWDTSSQLLSNWYYDGMDFDLKNMLDYSETRNNFYKEEAKNGIFDARRIAVSYFQMPLLDIKVLAKTNNIYNEFTMFDELEDQAQQLEFLDKANNNKNYFNKLKLEIKDKALNDFYNKINVNVIKDSEVVEFNGQDFLFLIHRIKGMLQGDITDKLNSDITEWGRNYEDNAYISCSLINQFYISFTEGEHLTLGFNDLKKGDILAMNTHDMCFLKKHIINSVEDSPSNYMSVEQLLMNTCSNYNEVVLRRFRDKEPIMPDYVVAFNEIDEQTKKAAKDLNIPVYLIMLEKYADRLINELKQLKMNDEAKYNLYVNRIKKCSSYHNCPLQEYYNTLTNNEIVTDTNTLKLIK